MWSAWCSLRGGTTSRGAAEAARVLPLACAAVQRRLAEPVPQPVHVRDLRRRRGEQHLHRAQVGARAREHERRLPADALRVDAGAPAQQRRDSARIGDVDEQIAIDLALCEEGRLGGLRGVEPRHFRIG